MRIFFTIDGVPVAKGRPRFARMGRGIRTYTPPRTEAYEAAVRIAARFAMGSTPLLEGPVRVIITAAMPIPQSWSKKKHAAVAQGVVPFVTRPDVDNLVKTILLDGMNGTIYKDDAQIVELTAIKRYDEKPTTLVTVEEVK